MATFVLQCSDVGAITPCCARCLKEPTLRTPVYPNALYDQVPDNSLGIRGLFCCHHIHQAQTKGRLWWYEQYLRLSARFTEDEITYALNASPERFWRIYGEIHELARRREVNKEIIRTTVKRVANSKPECPNCGSYWDETVCNNCGHN